MDQLRTVLGALLYLYFIILLARLVFDWIQVFARQWRPTGIVLVVADDGVEADRVDPVLRRVRVRHEVLWMTVADVDPSGGRTVRDVARGTLLPDVGSVDPGLVALFEASETERTHRLEQCLRRLGVSSARVTCEDDVVPAVLDLLARHARG